MHMSPEMPSCADLFAFELPEGVRFHDLKIHRVVSLGPIGEADLLQLVGRIRWPAGSPMAEVIAATLHERGISPPPCEESNSNGNGHWYPIPGQGIDGRIDDFDVLLGSEQFIEDAGIPLAEPSRSILAENNRNRWASMLVAAFHRVGGSREVHRSLLGILAVGRETRPVTSPETVAPSATAETTSTCVSVEGTLPEPLGANAASSENRDQRDKQAASPSASRPERQFALLQAQASAAGTTAPLMSVRSGPVRASLLWSRLTLKSRRARQVAILVCLACLSAMAGTATSCLSVSPDEAVIVQRFGGVVAVCGPGLHFRPLWPVEKLTTLQPGLIREVRFGSPAARSEPSTDFGGARVSNLFLTFDAALRISGRVGYAVDDATAFAFTLEEPGRLVTATTEAALVEALAGRSALWVMGPERGSFTAQVKGTLQQRLTALGAGIRIHSLTLDELALPPGTASVGVMEAFGRMALAETDKIAAVQKAQAEKERTVTDAKARAADLLNAAENERARTAETARALVRRVQAHLQAYRDDPAQVREQLILNLLSRDTSGRPRILVDPALSNKVQFMIGAVEPESTTSSSPQGESQPAAASQPAGGKS